MKKILYLILLIVHALSSITYSQSIPAKFERIGVEDGLSHSNVMCLVQDRKGFLWFGTKDGLCKYDGYKFTIYKRNLENNKSLSSNDIKSIVEDLDGNLWIGTWQGGLNRFNSKNGTFTQYRNNCQNHDGLSSDDIKCLYLDKNGNLWVGTGNDGLDLYDAKRDKFIHYTHIKNDLYSISDNAITCIKEDKRGDLWIGTKNGGLNRLDKNTGKFERFQVNSADPFSISHNNVQFIHEDKRDNLWIGTYGGGLNYFNKAKGGFVKTTLVASKGHNSNYNVLLSICEDERGNLWIGTENFGVISYNIENQTTNYFRNHDNDPSSISSNTINSILQDTKGNLWFGTSDGGINRISIDASKFTHYKHREGTKSLSNNIITSIYEDSKENLWIATDGGGLNLFDPKKKSFTHFTNEKGNPNTICGDNVLSVCEDSSGNLWIGTWGQGITVFNPLSKKYKHYKHDRQNTGSLSNNFAFSILKDSKNRIWIGTYGGGLNRYNEKSNSFIKYLHDDEDRTSLSSNLIICIYEDSKGRIWIGTEGAGVNLFDEENNKFISFKKQDNEYGLSNNYVGGILEDHKGTIWLSTNFGLNRLDPVSKKITKYFVKEGLPSDVISGLREDELGNLWIGTSKGLSKFNPENIEFKNYTIEDGLQANEFKSSCKTKKGWMYFGGRNGFNEFYPDSVKDLAFDPPIVFTKFEIFNKEVSIATDEKDDSPLKQNISDTEEIRLKHHQSVVSFEFASLNFTSESKKEYSYILENFDKDWGKLSSKNTLTYTNLDPGTYTLKVKGLKNDSAWSDKYAQIKLVILPPFWKTWWFQFLIVLLLITVVIIAFYTRTAAIRRQNLLLEKEVAKRTHELTEANYSLHEGNEEIKLQNERLEEYNGEIKRQSEKILKQQDQILLQNTELEKSVKELEKINHTKDKFFSILAHDLKNPVAALSGISDLLKKKVKQLDKQEIQDYVENINNSSNSVYSLLVNLLDWGRTQSQNITYSPVEINVYQIIVQNFSLLEPQLRSKNLSFKMNVNPAHSVFADQQMVDTVFRNVISNSIKFTPAYGEIVIESEETSSEIAVTIRDTGMGMTDVQLQNLFKIEKRINSNGTEGETGTGLGLIISKEFVELNKGELTVKSEPGKGASFTIKLPKGVGASVVITESLSSGRFPSTTKEKSEIRSHSNEKIKIVQGKHLLIVDDNKEIRAYLKLLLSEVFEISEAGNGVEGISAARELQPELIISDMIMPEMDGLEFCKQIKNNVNTSHIPVILLTSQQDSKNQLSGYEAGADVYLTKPIHEQILFQVISNILVSKEKLRQSVSLSDNLDPAQLGINKLDEEFLNKVIEFIEQNLSDADLDHRKICEITAMSRTLLYAKIKSLTGHGVHDFIKTIRIKKGLKLLLEGRLNINQIAYEVGFNTPSYFSKSFIKQFGVSPREYIANLKKEIKGSKGN